MPGLMAASIWIALVYTAEADEPPPESPSPPSPWALTTGRSRAETMPVVTVEDRPNGLPMAMTSCPVVSLSESPSWATVRSSGASLSWMTARSVAGSVPVVSAS